MPTIAHTPAEQQAQQDAQKQLLRDDPKSFAAKITAFQYLATAIFLFLASGFWDLQIQNPEMYSERADQNRFKSQPILAARGRLLDRDGRVIVDNHSSFSVILSRENLKPEHLKPIAEGLNLDLAELENKIRRNKRPVYEAVIIKQELTQEDLAFVESHRDAATFPELELIESKRRLYPKNGLAAHVVGYVSEVSENQLNSSEFANYNPGDIVGQTGIERQYNSSLIGVDGQRQVEVDNFGNIRKTWGIKPAQPGNDLTLSLDLDLQAVAELTMENRRGSVVALDPRTGEILAMVSRPAFDPNKFTGRIKLKDWNEVLNDASNPLLNRAIQAQLAPGSTFKPIMSIAGLETGTIDEKTTFTCPGGASFYGHYFGCHQRGGHGKLSLNRALAQSCDVFFYNVGNKLGIDTIAKYAEAAGLGHKTGVDLPQEKEGIMPSTAWKQKNYRQKWYAGETISCSIGQGAITVTPLQLAAAIGGIATGGVWQRPHLVRHPELNTPARKMSLNLENVQQVINGMYSVMENGTAARSRLPGIEMCGKTGTAQLASNAFLKGSSAGRAMKDNAWFVAFAPRSSPEIVVAVLFENGEHGPSAAPMARDVIKAYFDKKARQSSKPALMTVIQPGDAPGALHIPPAWVSP